MKTASELNVPSVLKFQRIFLNVMFRELFSRKYINMAQIDPDKFRNSAIAGHTWIQWR